MFSVSQVSYNQGVIMKKGTRQSIESKERMSKALKGKKMSEETKKKISDALKGRPKSEEHVNSVAKSNTGKKRSEEFKQYRSDYMKKAWAEGKMEPTIVNNKWAIPTIYNGVQMRSKLEARVASILDSNDIEWQYEPERFKLKEFVYTPDFYLPEFNIYLEVKGWDQGLEKIEALRNIGKCVVLVKEKDI